MKGFVIFLLITCCLLLTAGLRLSAGTGQSKLVPMRVGAVMPDPSTGGFSVVLLENNKKKKGRALVIGVGSFEGRAIVVSLAEKKEIRPMTHDLFNAALHRLRAKVERVVVHSVQDKTFFARMDIKNGRHMFSLDCRPSDGMALSLKSNAPVFVTEKVLKEAGLDWPPEKLDLPPLPETPPLEDPL